MARQSIPAMSAEQEESLFQAYLTTTSGVKLERGSQRYAFTSNIAESPY